MDLGNFFINDVGALLVEPVDDIADGSLVTGNKFRRENDRIFFFYFELFVVAGRHTR